jgi:superfamily II DNA/RNA helicase
MPLTRDELAEAYLAQLQYPPYPVQEEALLAWFTSEQGVLVCAPTGMGKTVIAEAALFEALHNGLTAYYTTPLIALTEQKFREMQAHAARWGFSPDDVGLVTGNRRVNPDARVLVVVAEILLNRLLNPSEFDFSHVFAVVMDEFHSFNDPERGVVWELSLSLLPRQIRLLLLSATVGNSREFVDWLRRCHGRKVDLVESQERRVPLTYHWVPDKLLNEQITEMVQGSEEERFTPALLFCFNRDECWEVAEQLKGRPLVDESRRAELAAELERLDFSQGAGSKLKQLLIRGVGVHHAGVLPKYRRLVEDLFVRKLLSVCVCTETLAAGINLPARSVVLATLLKGPPGKQRLIEASAAHQMFGRAGRPQFDTQGYVFVLAHEDDVKILRWKQKYDAIPDDTKDPGLLSAKKALFKKRPTRRSNQQYWTREQFEKLRASPPGKLASRGPLPWRLLAYMLCLSPDVERIRRLVHKRLLDSGSIEREEETLTRMLVMLHHGGYVALDPPPPSPDEKPQEKPEPEPAGTLKLFFNQPQAPRGVETAAPTRSVYQPVLARASERLNILLVFKSVNPLYGAFLVEQLGLADQAERLQALESVLELPRPVAKLVRVPFELPPGPLAMNRLDSLLVSRGLMSAPLPRGGDEDEEDERIDYDNRPPLYLPLADKLRLYFDSEYPGVEGLFTQPVWAAGDLLGSGLSFDRYVKSHDLIKQEGLIFRHLLRMILLCSEFAQAPPPELTAEQWNGELKAIADELTGRCREVDPQSTDRLMEELGAADPLLGG